MDLDCVWVWGRTDDGRVLLGRFVGAGWMLYLWHVDLLYLGG